MMNSTLDPLNQSSTAGLDPTSPAADPTAAAPLFCLLEAGYSRVFNVCLLEISVIVLLAVLIISGNLVVIFVFHCAPLVLSQHSTSAFIQTMAYADLLVGVSCLFPSLSLLLRHLPGARLLDPGLTCRAFAYLVSVLKSVSMVSLACVSVDRYVAVTRPLTYARLATAGRVRACVAAAWLYSAAVFLPCFAGWGKPGYHGDVAEPCATGWSTRPRFTAFIVALLYAPATLTVCFTYGHIFRICRQHTREISERRARYGPQQSPGGQRGDATVAGSAVAVVKDGVERGESPDPAAHRVKQPPPPQAPCPDKRYAMVLFRITSVFYILWLPYILYFLLESGGVYRHHVASFLTTWLAISNSFCNCLIYSLSNAAFRKGLKRLCSFCLRRDRSGGGLAVATSSKKAFPPPEPVVGQDYGGGSGYGRGEFTVGITCHV